MNNKRSIQKILNDINSIEKQKITCHLEPLTSQNQHNHLLPDADAKKQSDLNNQLQILIEELHNFYKASWENTILPLNNTYT